VERQKKPVFKSNQSVPTTDTKKSKVRIKSLSSIPEYKIISGSNPVVEKKLNELQNKYYINIINMQVNTTRAFDTDLTTTTVLLMITKK
jgi:hypothetical protein